MKDIIDWKSKTNEVCLNPRFPDEEKSHLLQSLTKAPPLEGHVWLAASGSTAVNVGHIKWVALSKQGILASAASVNKHFQCTQSDIWFNPLPKFHAGGLGIWARAYLTQSEVVVMNEPKWLVHSFYKQLNDAKATITALVPSQVYDLVINHLKAPEHLRAVIIGGDKMSESLYYQARELGWLLYPSYGLTETASQIATAPLQPSDPKIFPVLQLLSHVEINIDKENTISIKSPSLLTMYGFTQGSKDPTFVDPKINGWFTTEDKGRLEGKNLYVLGRTSKFVKIGGESVDLNRLEAILLEVMMVYKTKDDLALVAVPDPRLGHVIHLCGTAGSQEEIQPIIDSFQSKVLPFEKIRQVNLFETLPRTPLKKLQTNILLNQIVSK